MKKRQKRQPQKESLFESVIGGSYWDFKSLVLTSYFPRFIESSESTDKIISEAEPSLMKSIKDDKVTEAI
jgi:hypothetical protein